MNCLNINRQMLALMRVKMRYSLQNNMALAGLCVVQCNEELNVYSMCTAYSTQLHLGISDRVNITV